MSSLPPAPALYTIGYTASVVSIYFQCAAVVTRSRETLASVHDPDVRKRLQQAGDTTDYAQINMSAAFERSVGEHENQVHQQRDGCVRNIQLVTSLLQQLRSSSSSSSSSSPPSIPDAPQRLQDYAGWANQVDAVAKHYIHHPPSPAAATSSTWSYAIGHHTGSLLAAINTVMLANALLVHAPDHPALQARVSASVQEMEGINQKLERLRQTLGQISLDLVSQGTDAQRGAIDTAATAVEKLQKVSVAGAAVCGLRVKDREGVGAKLPGLLRTVQEEANRLQNAVKDAPTE
eukprot:gb/GECH01000783.1/.p1 GENE.gb/GECH01000783.1/~~gb/GECH01000783.1/.p1  ORF type:complete len:291 (+),score=70.50 gb/GECH01000783.1/:1-873(+)